MANRKPPSRAAAVGVVEHGPSAILITIGPDRDLIDRRDVVLTAPGLPTHPHHHEGSWAVGRYLSTPGARVLSLAEAVAIVERVRASAEHGARERLDALAATVRVPIGAIALRACPTLPPTIDARIADHRAQTVADSVMYRQALASAAAARGWAVRWYDREAVVREAEMTLAGEDLDAWMRVTGRSIGPPWRAAHRLAAAAALAALRPLTAVRRGGLQPARTR